MLKKFSLSSNYLYFALGIIFYALVSFFLVKSFKYEGMGLVNVLWSAFSVILVVGVGALYFKESITAVEMAAMFMIFAGVVVLKFHSA